MKSLFLIKINEDEFEINPGETILEGATRNEIDIPHSCTKGSCGACIVKVIGGEVEQLHVNRLGLSNDEKINGYILACISTPVTDMQIVKN